MQTQWLCDASKIKSFPPRMLQVRNVSATAAAWWERSALKLMSKCVMRRKLIIHKLFSSVRFCLGDEFTMRDDELYCKIDNDAYLRLTDGAIAIEEQSIKVENDKGTTSSESTDHSNYSEMCSNSGIFLLRLFYAGVRWSSGLRFFFPLFIWIRDDWNIHNLKEQQQTWKSRSH